MRIVSLLILVLFLNLGYSGFMQLGNYQEIESAEPEIVPEISLLEAHPEDSRNTWWLNWFRDENNNKIDDLIEDASNAVTDTFPIFIDYDCRPSVDDLARLETLDVQITYVAQYIDTVLASSVPFSTIKLIAELPNVVLIEIQPELMQFLDIGSPSVRSRSSDDYSPYTIMDLDYTGNGVNIAIIDTGADDVLHQSLRGKFVGGADFAGVIKLNNSNPDDEFGHGTHTSGTALGDGGRDGRYIGVAPNASLIDVKVSLGFGGDILEGIEWVIANKEAKNISVVSMSVGTNSNSDGTDAISREANAAVDAGMVVLSSAGNDGSNVFGAPAAADKVLAIGATSDKSTITRTDDSIAGFSNYGPRRDDKDDDDIDELKPEIVAPGVNINAPKHNTIDQYIPLSGTSMSCPIVAGIVALMLEANPELTPAEVRQILQDTAESRGTPSYTDKSAKYNTRYGYGIADAYGAVKRAENLLSGTYTGPSDAEPGKEYEFKFVSEFTRTEYTSGTENINVKISVPGSWSKPEQIQSTENLGNSGIISTSSTDEPVRSGNDWIFNVDIDFSGTLTTPYDIGSEIAFKTTVPENAPGGGVTTFRSTLFINGIESITTEHDVFVVPLQEDIDLSVNTGAISFSNENPIFGEDVVITALINNSGTTDARSVRVNFTDGPPLTAREIGFDVISNVQGQGSAEARVTWSTTPGVHTIYVVVDPYDVIEETDENNNMAPSQPVVVSGGVNNPPVAQLDIIPRDAGVNQPVTFDGSDSFDTDGDVVKYLFDYGDGTNSSWVDLEMIQHLYPNPGTYRATLRVEDNGGQKSLPDTMMVNVSDIGGGVSQYYFHTNYIMLETEPVSSIDNFVPIPSSTSGSVIPQWKYVGNWSTRDPLPAMDLDGSATFYSWVKNNGNIPINLIQLEFTLKVNGENVTEAATGRVTNLTPGGEPESIIVTADITPRRVKHDDIITVQVRSMVNSEDSVLIFGSIGHNTRVQFHYTLPALVPPVADAGGDATTYINQEVSFNGIGTDQDGTIVKYQWDFEGDSVFDWESTESGVTTYTYTQPGVYLTRLQVEDDDGLTAFDERTVTVNSGAPNQAPTVEITTPKQNDNLENSVMVTGYAEDEMAVTEVQISINFGTWTKVQLDAIGSGLYSWQYEWDTLNSPNGPNTFSARSYDGELYSTEISVSVNVDNEDQVPEIISTQVKPTSVPADDETLVRFTVEIYDDGLFDELEVLIDLRSIGGKKSTEMYDDGSHGDQKEDDGEFTIRTTVAVEIEPGDKSMTISVEDISGNRVTTDVELEVTEADIPGVNTPPEIVSVSAEPANAPNDGVTQVVFKVKVNDNEGLEDIQTVTIDLSSIGGTKNTLMADDGSGSGDKVAGDGTYTFTTVVSTSTELGEKKLNVVVTDQNFEQVLAQIILQVEQPGGTETAGTGFQVDDIFKFITQPTILLVIGLIIILIVVGVIMRVIQKGKKDSRVAHTTLTPTMVTEQETEFQETDSQMEL